MFSCLSLSWTRWGLWLEKCIVFPLSVQFCFVFYVCLRTSKSSSVGVWCERKIRAQSTLITWIMLFWKPNIVYLILFSVFQGKYEKKLLNQHKKVQFGSFHASRQFCRQTTIRGGQIKFNFQLFSLFNYCLLLFSII